MRELLLLLLLLLLLRWHLEQFLWGGRSLDGFELELCDGEAVLWGFEDSLLTHTRGRWYADDDDAHHHQHTNVPLLLLSTMMLIVDSSSSNGNAGSLICIRNISMGKGASRVFLLSFDAAPTRSIGGTWNNFEFVIFTFFLITCLVFPGKSFSLHFLFLAL